MIIKEGNWVVTHHPYLRSSPPASVAEVLNVRKKVKVRYANSSKRYSLLRFDEVIGVFPDEERARAAAKRAKTAWDGYEAQVTELEAALIELKKERRDAATRELETN